MWRGNLLGIIHAGVKSGNVGILLQFLSGHTHAHPRTRTRRRLSTSCGGGRDGGFSHLGSRANVLSPRASWFHILELVLSPSNRNAHGSCTYFVVPGYFFFCFSSFNSMLKEMTESSWLYGNPYCCRNSVSHVVQKQSGSVHVRLRFCAQGQHLAF